MKVQYHREAFAQLGEITRTIESNDPRAAASFVRRVEALVGLIARRPEIGRPTQLPTVRVVPTRPFPYLLFYSSAPGGITVLRVRHMARRDDWRIGQ